MSTITRIENTFSQTDFDNAMNALDVLSQALTDTKGLSVRAKSRLFRMGKANMGFVESAKRAITALPDLRPAFLDPAEFERDVMLIKATKALRLKMLEVASKIEDTELLMGNHAFQSSLAVYRVVQSAYRMGYGGVKPYYDEMHERWPQPGRRIEGSSEDGEFDPNREEESPMGNEAPESETEVMGGEASNQAS